MSSISSLFASSTWQSWSLSSASTILGYESEDETDLLGADFLSGADAALVSLSEEAQAILDGQEAEGLDLASIMEDMSYSQITSMAQTTASGEVVSAMLGSGDLLSVLLS